jgi:predicted DNA-binding protein
MKAKRRPGRPKKSKRDAVSARVGLALSEDMRKRLERLAEDDGVSLSEMVRRMVERGLGKDAA